MIVGCLLVWLSRRQPNFQARRFVLLLGCCFGAEVAGLAAATWQIGTSKPDLSFFANLAQAGILVEVLWPYMLSPPLVLGGGWLGLRHALMANRPSKVETRRRQMPVYVKDTLIFLARIIGVIVLFLLGISVLNMISR